jgi:hypothetical protein
MLIVVVHIEPSISYHPSIAVFDQLHNSVPLIVYLHKLHACPMPAVSVILVNNLNVKT